MAGLSRFARAAPRSSRVAGINSTEDDFFALDDTGKGIWRGWMARLRWPESRTPLPWNTAPDRKRSRATWLGWSESWSGGRCWLSKRATDRLEAPSLSHRKGNELRT